MNNKFNVLWLEGRFVCVGYSLPSVIEEKGEGFENGKILLA
ncbi:MAG: hypothetical protein ABSC20_02730 [Candidatus Bathyarchaeia archaeon]